MCCCCFSNTPLLRNMNSHTARTERKLCNIRDFKWRTRLQLMHFNSFLKLCMCHARGALKGHSRPPLTYTMAPNVAVIKFASTFFSKSPTNGNILETHAHAEQNSHGAQQGLLSRHGNILLCTKLDGCVIKQKWLARRTRSNLGSSLDSG